MIQKKLLSLNEKTINKINELSNLFNFNKSKVVDFIVDEFKFDLDLEIIDLITKRTKKVEEIKKINKRLKEIDKLKKYELIMIDSLKSKKSEFKKNIKRKFEEGNKLEGIEIAKRVSYLVKCNYLELLPK